MNISEAVKVVDTHRFKWGVDEFMVAFIDEWAYQQTGLYPSENKIVHEPAFKEVAKKLCDIVHRLLLDGYDDPLGYLLSEFHKGNVKNNAFFPTSSSVSDLMSKILDASNDEDGGGSLYEPCCGTGSIALKNIESVYHRNSHKDFPLGESSLVLEDINATALKACMIQFVHKLQYLEDCGQKSSVMKDVKFVLGNTLTQQNMTVLYHFQSPNELAD